MEPGSHVPRCMELSILIELAASILRPAYLIFAHPIVGMMNSGSVRTPDGQRVVMVLRRV